MQEPTRTNVAQTFDNVNPLEGEHQLPPFSDRLNTHSNVRGHVIRGNRDKVWRETRYYGCSASYKFLTRGLFLKRFHHVNQVLQGSVGLTTGEAYAALGLLLIGVYYGKVYPKAAHFSGEPGRSKSTFRRATRKLKNLGLITVIPRYLEPYRRQISNLYKLEKLLLVIARYLSEHGQRFAEKWLQPYLLVPGSLFWRSIWEVSQTQVKAPQSETPF